MRSRKPTNHWAKLDTSDFPDLWKMRSRTRPSRPSAVKDAMSLRRNQYQRLEFDVTLRATTSGGAFILGSFPPTAYIGTATTSARSLTTPPPSTFCPVQFSGLPNSDRTLVIGNYFRSRVALSFVTTSSTYDSIRSTRPLMLHKVTGTDPYFHYTGVFIRSIGSIKWR